MEPEYQDNRCKPVGITATPEDIDFIKNNNLSPTKIYRDAVNDIRVGKKKDTFETRFEYFKGRVVLIVFGLVCFALSQFRSIDIIWKLLFLISGGLLVFYGIFDMLLKILPMVKKK